jgi:uncharacterized Zn finger protein
VYYDGNINNRNTIRVVKKFPELRLSKADFPQIEKDHEKDISEMLSERLRQSQIPPESRRHRSGWQHEKEISRTMGEPTNRKLLKGV